VRWKVPAGVFSTQEPMTWQQQQQQKHRNQVGRLWWAEGQCNADTKPHFNSSFGWLQGCRLR
jgi:hypothetical protein